MKDNILEKHINHIHALKTAGLALLLTACLSGVVRAASDTATITITGTVKASTCTIDSDSANKKVTLPDIADRDIQGKGKTGGTKDIDIVLKDCGASVTTVLVTASGNADDENTGAFKNSLTDGADGVALYFYKTDKTGLFNPQGTETETSTLTPSQDNTLTYQAAYVGTKDKVTAGAFSTVVNMKFNYQ